MKPIHILSILLLISVVVPLGLFESPMPNLDAQVTGTIRIQIGSSTTSTAVVTTFVNCSPSVIDIGSSSFCTATVTGASGSTSGETISWTQSGGTGSVIFLSGTTCILSGTSCSATVIGTSIGNPTVRVSYSGDSRNGASSGTLNLTVNTMLSAPSITVSQTVISQGKSVTLTSMPLTTGTPPYTFQWLARGPTELSYSPIPGATSSSYTFGTTTSTTVGVWSFELKVTDSDPSMTSTLVMVKVNPAAPIPEYSFGLPLLVILLVIGYGFIRRRIKKSRTI